MNSILEGVRVIDWTIWHQGPFACALLTDLGAEVIHVEQLGQGDPLRGHKKAMGLPLEVGGRHIIFEDINYSKKGIAIDLSKPQGKEIIQKLVSKSDVFVTNFRQKAVGKFGLDYESLSRDNPQLIYALGSGFGTNGPDAEAPSLDLIATARSGIMFSAGQEGTPPTMVGVTVGDRIGGLFLSYGIIAALLARQRTGEGQKVEASQLGSLIALQGVPVAVTLVYGQDLPRNQRDGAVNPLYNFYQCQDGEWIAFGMLQSDRYWPAFCQAIGIPELEKNPKFENWLAREKNSRELVKVLDKVFATKKFKKWREVFRAGDFIFSKINRLSDLASDPQILANEYITNWDHPAMGSIKCIGSPLKFSKSPLSPRSAAPEIGQDTEDVLVNICNYGWEEIEELRKQEVI